jgi:glycosyltransferase involved in cell wall biosynthesis
LLKWQSARSLANSDRVIAVSEFVGRELLDKIGVPVERVRRIYHGRDEGFSPSGDVERDKRLLATMGISAEYILTSGSLLPYRRCEDVVAAFSRYHDTHPELHLVIAGSGTDSRYARVLKHAIRSAHCGERIHCIGHVGNEEMRALYRRSRLFVFATEVEACPNIAIEAMASGCVIVCADKEPLPEMFGDGAVRFRPRDIDDLAKKMERCLDDKNQRDYLKKCALARAQEFSWKRCARETYDALTDWGGGEA